MCEGIMAVQKPIFTSCLALSPLSLLPSCDHNYRLWTLRFANGPAEENANGHAEGRDEGQPPILDFLEDILAAHAYLELQGKEPTILEVWR